MFVSTAADWASIVGLFTGLAGFILTIYLLFRAKSIAEAGREAGEKALAKAEREGKLRELTETIGVLRDIKEAHRNGDFQQALKCYPRIRGCLIRLKTSGILNNDKEQQLVQGAIGQINTLEKTVDSALAGQKEPNAPKWNKIVTRIHENMETIYENLRMTGD